MYSARPADPVVEVRWSDDLEAWSPPEDLLVGPGTGRLEVTPLARKLDSPHLFLWGDEPFLIARRQVAFGGRYDRDPRWAPSTLTIQVDQVVWSPTRKRSALYRVDADRATVSFELDLPSRGDTSFAAVVPEPDDSSPASGGDVMWLRGQLRTT